MTTLQIALAIMGLLNVYVIFALSRHAEWKKSVDHKLFELEKCSISEDRFRKIIQEELQGFELRLIKEGQLGHKDERNCQTFGKTRNTK